MGNYDEIFKLAKAAYGTGAYDDATLEFLFPELEESEDEKIRKWIASYIHRGVFNEEEHPKALKAIEWLEKQGDINQEYIPREDHERIRDEYYEQGLKDGMKRTDLEAIKEHIRHDYISGDVNKRLKECGWHITEEETVRWSKEDERLYGNLIGYLDGTNGMFEEGANACIKWLESIRKRNSWKPSDEQMYILNWVANILLNHDGIVEEEASKRLQSLYNDLQKLM